MHEGALPPELEESAILENTLPAIYPQFSKSIKIRGCRELALYLAPEATSSCESNIQDSKPGQTIKKPSKHDFASPARSSTLPVLDPLVVELRQCFLAPLQVFDRLPRVVALAETLPFHEVTPRLQ